MHRSKFNKNLEGHNAPFQAHDTVDARAAEYQACGGLRKGSVRCVAKNMCIYSIIFCKIFIYIYKLYMCIYQNMINTLQIPYLWCIIHTVIAGCSLFRPAWFCRECKRNSLHLRAQAMISSRVSMTNQSISWSFHKSYII